MLKGINQWCFPEGTPLDKVFLYAQQAAFDAIELNVNPEHDIGLTLSTTINEAEAIARRAEAFGLKLRSLSTSLLWKWPLSSPDTECQEKGRRVIEKQLELASAMGVDTVLVVPGVVTETTSYEQCWARSQAQLEELLPIAERHQVKIGIENVWNKFLLSPMEMVQYIDAFHSPWLGAYFDVGNVVRYGYPEQWMHSLGKRIMKVHVKDYREANGFVPLLAGAVNWQAVTHALEAIGYTDTVTAELSPYQSLPEQLAYDTSKQMDAILRCSEKIEG
ncbi:hexulose-6-phosphate isomerase [Pullulanibacillus camelliae]|uniref:Hexulose-6-phosphate isomerase n=1 Tax=Pullulanibacillus camelliae TaxID=1707096 RepID=A0A8J2VRT2_9BACL|nr:sugar phosphate isomerase/epimerase family protein [Pullulanibacillus camelliae]GGE38172.1 hexulose-6-phosphate isomerase [Pullulanibacillus camelliae]